MIRYILKIFIFEALSEPELDEEEIRETMVKEITSDVPKAR